MARYTQNSAGLGLTHYNSFPTRRSKECGRFKQAFPLVPDRGLTAKKGLGICNIGHIPAVTVDRTGSMRVNTCIRVDL